MSILQSQVDARKSLITVMSSAALELGAERDKEPMGLP